VAEDGAHVFLGHLKVAGDDPGFWLFKEYFNLSLKDTFRSWTVMESVAGVVGLLCVLGLNMVVCRRRLIQLQRLDQRGAGRLEAVGFRNPVDARLDRRGRRTGPKDLRWQFPADRRGLERASCLRRGIAT
jgi:hypothetical protein